MDDQPERWQAVGAAIAARIDALGLTKAEVIRKSGVSAKTLDGYMAGEPIVRADKKRGLCRALRWSPDSVSRILDGRQPIETEEAEPADPLAAFEARLTRIEAMVEELVRSRQREAG